MAEQRGEHQEAKSRAARRNARIAMDGALTAQLFTGPFPITWRYDQRRRSVAA